jgi:glycosyltransferase involved in cell wall biosynthesis
MRGGQHQVLLLMQSLRDAGHYSTLLALAGSPLFRAAAERSIPVLPATGRALRRESRRFDIVHAHDAHAHTWCALFCRAPFVVSRRVAFPVSPSLLSRWKYRRAARFLAVSRFVATRLEQAGIPPSKIEVVYDAVASVPPLKAWNPDAPVIALASEDALKGRALVERAAALTRLPIQFSTDLTKDLQYASAFLYVTRTEGLGSAALLAMSMSIPLIATPVEGLAEVFEPDLSGLAVQHDPASIAYAVERLHDDPALAHSLIAQAHGRVQTHFTALQLLESTLAAYRRVVAS